MYWDSTSVMFNDEDNRPRFESLKASDNVEAKEVKEELWAVKLLKSKQIIIIEYLMVN